jgi:proteasome lid subunit RPN8/RPN11
MLQLPRAIQQQITDHAAAGYPQEVCGLLVGTEHAAAPTRRVQQAHRGANLRQDRSGDRYELDPKAHLRIQKQARQQGLRIIGVYHSHPDAAAVPSATDRRRAADIWGPGPSWSYLIIPVHAQGAGQPRSWILHNGVFEEEPLC